MHKESHGNVIEFPSPPQVETKTPGNADPEFDGLIQKLERLKEGLSALSGKAAERAGRLMEEMQKILADLSSGLAAMEKSSNWITSFAGAQSAKFDEISNSYKVAGTYVTMGEIITDREWGVRYNLDNSIDAGERKHYLKECAKRDLRKVLDELIILDKTENQHLDWGRNKAYLARDQEPDESHAGLIAEKMVRNILKKISIDLENAGFLIEEADISQDVEGKIDFIIKVKRTAHKRGVSVEASGEAESIGIQFSLNTSEANIQHKGEQIKRVKQKMGPGSQVSDLVLVTIPMRNVLETYKQWNKQRKPGGPDKLLAPATREKIIRGVLDGLLEPRQIESFRGSMAIAA